MAQPEFIFGKGDKKNREGRSYLGQILRKYRYNKYVDFWEGGLHLQTPLVVPLLRGVRVDQRLKRYTFLKTFYHKERSYFYELKVILNHSIYLFAAYLHLRMPKKGYWPRGLYKSLRRVPDETVTVCLSPDWSIPFPHPARACVCECARCDETFGTKQDPATTPAAAIPVPDLAPAPAPVPVTPEQQTAIDQVAAEAKALVDKTAADLKPAVGQAVQDRINPLAQDLAKKLEPIAGDVSAQINTSLAEGVKQLNPVFDEVSTKTKGFVDDAAKQVRARERDVIIQYNIDVSHESRVSVYRNRYGKENFLKNVQLWRLDPSEKKNRFWNRGNRVLCDVVLGQCFSISP